MAVVFGLCKAAGGSTLAVVDHRVYLEGGRTWVFAAALDWPGWCRRGKGESGALEQLAAYADRYRAVVGPAFQPRPLRVVGTVPGSRMTDFGALGGPGSWDQEPLPGDEAERLADLVQRCWTAFDGIADRAPEHLRRGPRGGGRDRTAIVGHVREAERSYARKLGVRCPPRTEWPDQRREIRAALVGGGDEGGWPRRYAARRIAWHVLDHAWEIEDRAG